jgi:hypothetical protein
MRKLFILPGLLVSSFTAMGADMSNGADNFYRPGHAFFRANLR